MEQVPSAPHDIFTRSRKCLNSAKFVPFQAEAATELSHFAQLEIDWRQESYSFGSITFAPETAGKNQGQIGLAEVETGHH